MDETYELIGKPAQTLEPKLSFESAAKLVFAAGALMNVYSEQDMDDGLSRRITTLNATEHVLGERHDIEVANVSAVHAGALNLVSRRIGAITSSHLIMRFGRYRDTQYSTKIYTQYTVDTEGDRVVNAIRSLYVIRDVPITHINQRGYRVRVGKEVQRKRTHKQMGEDDVEDVIRRLNQLRKRTEVSGRK